MNDCIRFGDLNMNWVALIMHSVSSSSVVMVSWWGHYSRFLVSYLICQNLTKFAFSIRLCLEMATTWDTACNRVIIIVLAFLIIHLITDQSNLYWVQRFSMNQGSSLVITVHELAWTFDMQFLKFLLFVRRHGLRYVQYFILNKDICLVRHI